MQALGVLAVILAAWWPEERSGAEHHPSLSFESATPEDTALSYDVLNYRLVLGVDIPAETLWAEAEITLRLLTSADSVRLHFVGLEVSGVEVDGAAGSFSRADSFLIVMLGSAAPAGSEHILKVAYHGKPTLASGGFGRGLAIDGSDSEDAVTYACNAPWGAKYWFPCQDNPADKATLEMVVTVPSGYEVISNGKLDSAERTGQWWSFHWRETHPIATYLTVFAASKHYSLTQDAATVNGVDVSVYHWVLKTDSAQITPKLMVAAEAMEYFSELFYPYPFADEKYAQVYAPVGGAMENQTCTHINTDYDWGDWDIVVTHELSHSWWGNSTTCRDLKHMWLNEGFATYCEALWVEHRDGPQAYDDYVRTQIMQPYLQAFSAHRYPILDFPWSMIYSPLTYEKGASVLHMLRRITGDEEFFSILRTYGERYQDSTALSGDFEAVAEEVTGSDLGWFFEQWLRQAGHPHYLVTWEAIPSADTTLVILRLRQTQNWPPDVGIFRMPVEFGLIEGTDTTFVSFTDSLDDQTFTLKRASAPDEVVFDPHGDLLCKIEYSGLTEQNSTEPHFVCPDICRNTLRYRLDDAAPEQLTLELYDVGGRMLERWRGLKPTGRLDVRDLPAGVYFVRLTTPASAIRRVVLLR